MMTVQVLKEGQVLGHLYASPLQSISPSADRRQTVFTIQHDGTVNTSYTSDQIRVRLYGSLNQLIDEECHQLPEELDQAAGRHYHELPGNTSESRHATLAVTYEYQSERDEEAFLKGQCLDRG